MERRKRKRYNWSSLDANIIPEEQFLTIASDVRIPCIELRGPISGDSQTNGIRIKTLGEE